MTNDQPVEGFFLTASTKRTEADLAYSIKVFADNTAVTPLGIFGPFEQTDRKGEAARFWYAQFATEADIDSVALKMLMRGVPYELDATTTMPAHREEELVPTVVEVFQRELGPKAKAKGRTWASPAPLILAVSMEVNLGRQPLEVNGPTAAERQGKAGRVWRVTYEKHSDAVRARDKLATAMKGVHALIEED
jgi:hypothetical protein